MPPSARVPQRAHCPSCICKPHCLLGNQREAELQAWAPFLTERAFRKGERLLQQGHTESTLRVIKVGMVLALRSGDDGHQRPVGMVGCGQLLGSTALLQQPASLSCDTLSSGRVCEVDIATVRSKGLVDHAFLQSLTLNYLQTNERLADWARIARIRTVMGQLAGTLLQLSSLQRSTLVRLPNHAVLAALLASTRETVARTLRQLEAQQGLTRRDRWHCEIERTRLQALVAATPQ